MFPIINSAEIRTSVRNAWNVLIRRPDAMTRFTFDPRSVLLSFWVIVLLLPIQIGSQAQEIIQFKADSGSLRMLNAHLVGVLCFAISWLLFPVIIAKSLETQGKLHRLAPYLVVHNWTMGVFAAVSFVISLVALIALPPAVTQPILFAVMVYGLMLRWRIKKEMLELSSGKATWYTILDIVLLGVLFMPYLDSLGITQQILEAQREALAGQL